MRAAVFDMSLRQISLVVGVLLGLVLVVVSLRPLNLPVTPPPAPADSVWALPSQVSIDSDAAVSAISQRRLWGASAVAPEGIVSGPADEKSLTPSDWHIRGIYSAGGRPVAILAVDGEPVKQLAVGDTLPGGAKILDIAPYRLTVLLGRQRLYLSTYQE